MIKRNNCTGDEYQHEEEDQRGRRRDAEEPLLPRIVGDGTLRRVVRRNSERGRHTCTCSCNGMASRFIMSEFSAAETRLDQNASTCGLYLPEGGNLSREEKEKTKTQPWKVSYAKTRLQIYCKCDLYAKKLTMVKGSATLHSMLHEVYSETRGVKHPKGLRPCAPDSNSFQRELGVFRSVLHRSHLPKTIFFFNV